VITSKDNQQLKTIRKLLSKRRDGLFVAEGEDLVEAAAAHGWEPVILLRSGVDVEPELMPSALGSGSRVVGVYEERWAEPGGALSVYLHGVHDPGNVGTIVRSAHALADGRVILGPDCADPYGPKAVRASMGSIFARPPARARFESLTAATTVALDPSTEQTLEDLQAEPPVVLCVGGERHGLPADLRASHRARIALRSDGPDSLNAAISAAIGLYRMAGHA
jgi:RNA methyltransferase, TrmH family